MARGGGGDAGSGGTAGAAAAAGFAGSAFRFTLPSLLREGLWAGAELWALSHKYWMYLGCGNVCA